MSATIHFFIRTDQPLKNGSAPIYLIFTLHRTLRLRISLGRYIPLKNAAAKKSREDLMKLTTEERDKLYYWDPSKERATKGFTGWESINVFLDKEKARANEILDKYERRGKVITLDLFKNAFTRPTSTDIFKDYFYLELERRRNTISKETYKAYKAVINKISAFKPNMTLAHLDYRFLVDFEAYMSKPVSQKGLGNIPSTISKTLRTLRTFVQIAIKNDDFPKEANPFADYRIKHIDPVLTSRDYLEPQDLFKIEALLSPEKINTLRESEVRSVKRFLFACYTGLRFADVNKLKRSEHVFSKWVLNPSTNQTVFKHYIEIRMSKTNQPVFIPLIDRALEIIDEGKGEYIFEPISNQKVNKHLKEINKKAGLNKKLSFHVARHSFATICFLYGIPERVGQKLLGHKNRKFTEVYTHLSQNKLFYEMDKLNRGLTSFELLLNEQEGQTNNIGEILPLLQSLNPDQVKGLVKFLGSGNIK